MICKKNQALYLSSVVLEVEKQTMADFFHSYLMVSVIIQKKGKKAELIQNANLAKKEHILHYNTWNSP